MREGTSDSNPEPANLLTQGRMTGLYRATVISAVVAALGFLASLSRLGQIGQMCGSEVCPGSDVGEVAYPLVITAAAAALSIWSISDSWRFQRAAYEAAPRRRKLLYWLGAAPVAFAALALVGFFVLIVLMTAMIGRD